MASMSQIEILLPELRAHSRFVTSGADDAEDLVQDANERALGAVRPIRTGLSKDNMTVLYAAPSWRHSAIAAVRLSLKLSRE